jgi:pyridoxamine 5'-phosphate oxidase
VELIVPDPFVLFSAWYEEAQHDPLMDPNIVALATASRNGRPSVRMVLYRGIREGGFSFFTNYESRKGRELAENPFAALAFYWPHLGRQVRIEGTVERLSPTESDAYFQQRPFLTQITAAASLQSQVMHDEGEFLMRLAELERRSGGRIPRPPFWGGYKLLPSVFEFWTHRDNRRHERWQYEREGMLWKQSRLYP